ncbi:MAG: MBL fold metallo-hydrolase [Bacillota bacterium]|nr:MAG: MBL fold metallo-hydrolase [Bacillota bacterium]
MVVGPFQANCYLVTDPENAETVVIDPGAEAKDILKVIHEEGLKVVAIVNTHGHVDHVGAAAKVREATGAPVLIHSGDARMLQSPLLSLSALMPGAGGGRVTADRELSDGDTVTFGRFELEVRHTPGHSPGGVSLLVNLEPDAPSLCFSGDTLFAGSIGRTDLQGGNWDTLEASIRKVIYSLPDRTVVLPGHGPETTVGREKRANAFVRG